MQIVGRDAEIAVLDSAIEGISRGERRLLIVHGEAGIGKTRLLGHLADRARAQRLEPLIGRATELESGVPLALFRGALPTLPQPSAEDADGRWVLFRTLIEQLESRARLVVVLDDIHWADPLSRDLLEMLVRRPPDVPHVLVIAGRPAPALNMMMAAARSVGRAFTDLALGPLSRGAADGLMDSRWAAEQRDRMFETSGGNPLYLEELAKGDDSGRVPAGLIAAVSVDLAALGDAARALVRAGALLGDPFDIDVARRTADLDLDAALTAIDELIERGLVRGTEALREFAFRHPVIRSAVYQGQSPGGRLAGHARAAAVLADANGPIMGQARHLALTAAPGDTAAAGILREAAGLVRSQAPSIAADWLLAARRAAATDDQTLASELAEALVQSGRLDEALTVADESTSSSDRSQGQGLRLTVVAASVERLLGRHDASLRRLSRALEESSETSGTIEVMAALALSAYELGDYERMAHLASQVRAEETADPLVRGVASAMLAIGYRFAGRLDESELEGDLAVAAVRGSSDQELCARTELIVAIPWALVAVERFGDGLEVARRGSAAARVAGNIVGSVPLGIAEVLALGLIGRIDEAVVAAEQTELAARLSHNDQSLQWALWMRAWIMLEAGDVDAAMAAASESVALAKELDQSALVTIGNAVLGSVLLAAGQPSAAQPLLAAYDLEPGWISRWAPRLVEAELELGWLDVAAASVDRAVAVSRESGLNGALAAAERAGAMVALARDDRPTAARLATSGAMVALARDDRPTAARLATSAIQRASELGARLDEAQARMLAATIATDRDEAARQLRSAYDLARAGGARRTAEEATRHLRKLGLRIGRGGARGIGRQGVDSLSGREREIADLVARGMTNREIATRLFLSDKTVESHLSKAFAKLGVTSRAGVAAQVSAVGMPRTSEATGG